MVSKRNVSIQIIRVIAMLMIILDHLFAYIQIPMKSLILQVSNSGVLIFLLISGYLYGNKGIDDWKRWFQNRIIRICFPMWIFMIVDFIVEAAVWNYFDIRLVFVYALNMQGILGVNIAGAALWFLTLIMICYFITPLLQWIKQKKLSLSFGVAVLVIAVILQIVLAYITDIGMVNGHTLSWCMIAIGMYVIGYFAGNKILSDAIGKYRIISMTVLAIIASGIVLIANRSFDGQIIYDRIIVFYGLVIVDLWICTILYKLGTYVKGKRFIRMIGYWDSISYEFYIVHGLIIMAVTYSILLKFGVMAYILSTLVLTWAAAVVLHKACGMLQKSMKS